MMRTKTSYVKLLITLCLFAILLYGCARTPSGISPIDIREMSITASFAAPINDSYYYFFPIDLNGGNIGPIPVFSGTAGTQAWVTGSATHYVQYHQRQYSLYKITNLNPFQSESIGSPLRYVIPDIGSNIISFTIDLNQLGAHSSTVDVNIIAIDQPALQTRLLDALGPRGNDFLNINILSNRTYTNNELSIEFVNDVMDYDSIVQPSSERTKPLDISDWSISISN